MGGEMAQRFKDGLGTLKQAVASCEVVLIFLLFVATI